MPPLAAIILKAESTHDRRIAYATNRKLTANSFQQDHHMDDWVTVNYQAFPVVMFGWIQSILIDKGLMKGAQYIMDFVTSFVRVCIRPSSIRRCGKNILRLRRNKNPLHENREGYWGDLELVHLFGTNLIANQQVLAR